MPLSNLHTLDPATYAARLRGLMEQLEGRNDPLGAYFDTANPVQITIGVGFNIDLDVNRTRVMDAMSLSAAEQAAVNIAWRSAELNAIRNQPVGDARTSALRTYLNGVLAPRRAFVMTAAEVNTAFATFVTIHSSFTNIPALSLERMALVSMHFNSPALIGPGLQSALAMVDPYEARAEAWYQIRYDHANQLHKRRYVEAALFGLYGEGISTAATDAQAQAQALGIYRMFTRHGRNLTQSSVAMVDYDTAFANQISQAQGELNAAGLGTILVQDLRATLEPARDALVAWLNPQLASDRQLTASAWNSAAIYIAPGGANPAFLDAALDDWRGADMQNNLLIGGAGSDNIYGGAGNDVLVGRENEDRLRGDAGNDDLYGGDGNDYLAGGADADRLYGGNGYDTYVIDLRDGVSTDQIVDSGGGGQIIIIGHDGKVLNTKVFTREGTQNAWVDPDGTVTISHNSPWRLTLSDGSVIELGEDFNAAGFGMTLQEEATPTTATLTGDFSKQTNVEGTAWLRDADGNYVNGGVQAGAADQITGTAASELIQGLLGDDALLGRAGDDVIEGGAGNDLLMGGLGADELDGGDGNDIIYGSSDGALYYPTDTSYQRASPAQPVVLGLGFTWLHTSPGPDADGFEQGNLSSNVDRDQQAGDAGNVIDGGAGQDSIYAGTGADVVHGGDDADDIVGMAGGDMLYGDAGNDRIRGDGADYVPPGFENVTQTAAALHGADMIDGGLGNDLLIGQGSDDVLYGGLGDDELYGDDRDNLDTPNAVNGADYLDGGDGADDLVGGGRNDDLFGGLGDDRLWGDGGAVATTSAGFVQVLYQGDDHLDGEEGNDYLQGEGGADDLFGGIGNDILVGDDDETRLAGASHGTDYLDGEDGDDQLRGDGGADTLFGGAGVDTLDGDAAESVVAGQFHGADYLDGEDGNDLLLGRGGNDSLVGGAGNDQLQGDSATSTLDGQFHGQDDLDGGDGDDLLIGGGSDDILAGGAGNDQLQGDAIAQDVAGQFHGADALDGGDGDDLLFGGGGADNLIGGAGSDTLHGDAPITDLGAAFHGNDTLDGGDGNDVLWGDAGNDTLYGGEGSDWLAGEDQVSLNAITTLSGDDVLFGGGGNDTLIGGSGVDALDGGDGDDTLAGGDADDSLTGGSGNDVLDGGAGNDSYYFGRYAGSDVLNDSAGNDTLFLDAGISQADVSLFRVGNDLVLSLDQGPTQLRVSGHFAGSGQVDAIRFADATIWDAATIASLASTGTPNTMFGSAADDTYVVDSTGDIINEPANAGVDTVLASIGYTLGANLENLTLTGYLNINGWGNAQNNIIQGNAGDNVLEGLAGSDQLFGNAGTDILRGGDGSDTLDGGTGADRMEGGLSFDAYTVDNVGDVIAEVNEAPPILFGTVVDWAFADSVVSSVSYTLPDNVESITASGSTATTLIGNAAANRLNGGPTIAANELRGGAGDDWYVLGPGDSAVENPGEGYDTIESAYANNSAPWLMPANVEKATVTSLSGGSTVVGNASDEFFIVQFGTGGDTVDAGGGNDTIYGASTNTTFFYELGDGRDTIIENSLTLNTGLGPWSGDRILFGAGINAAQVQLSRQGNDLWIQVNGPNEGVLQQEFFAPGYQRGPVEYLQFADGTIVDLLPWFAQSSFYGSLATAGDDVITAGTGDDLIYGLTGNDSLSGSSGNDLLNGGDGNDTLNGGTGGDVLVGGAGNDAYVVDSATDVIAERANEGFDTVQSSISWTLGAELENLTLTGSAAINGTGNAIDNLLTGNAGANVLTGGTGNDTYVVATGDSVVEAANEGADTIQSSITWTIASAVNVENLTLTGSSAVNATGNGLDNVLTGNGGVNVLTGGAGNDTYVVTTGDTTSEAAGAGTDTVLSAVTWTLATNLENLILTGSANINATGNTLANVLTGNAGNNSINGGTGTDTMAGGAGNDSYTVDNVGDVVTELVGEGTDLVSSSVTHTLSANVENLTLTSTSALNGTGNGLDNVLTGNSANNTLTGLAGNDTLDGGTGNDTMVGGLGNDTYVVNATGDVVTELSGEGLDTIQTTVTLASLAANVENLTLLGTSTLAATGNGLDNVLTGNSANNTLTGNAGNDTLDGLSGTDTMRGGTGDDIYIVERTADIVTENLNEGSDTIRTSVTLATLAANVENLTLLGTSALSATGNSLANILIGNAGANVMQGAAGADTYDGGAGNDTFTDSDATSNDTYRWGTGAGLDTLTDSGGALDHVDLFAGIASNQLQFTHVGNNLELTILGNTLDKLTMNGWYTSAANRIEEFRLGDGSVVLGSQFNALGAGQSTGPSGASGQAMTNALIDAMAAFGASAATTGPTMSIQPVRAGVHLTMPSVLA